MSRINSSAKGTYQDAGNDETYDFTTYEGEPLKAGKQGHSYMGTLEDTVTRVAPPIHNLDTDASDSDQHGHSPRQLTPG